MNLQWTERLQNVLLVCGDYLVVAMWGNSVYCLFLSSPDETKWMWLFLSHHSRLVVWCISGLPPSALTLVPGWRRWQSMCRDDDGGCHRRFGVELAGVSCGLLNTPDNSWWSCSSTVHLHLSLALARSSHFQSWLGVSNRAVFKACNASAR